MAVGPRRIVTNVLLMPALQFSDPVAAFIHMKINDLCIVPATFAWMGFMVFLLVWEQGRMGRKNRSADVRKLSKKRHFFLVR
jgi:hypothetical protein